MNVVSQVDLFGNMDVASAQAAMGLEESDRSWRQIRALTLFEEYASVMTIEARAD